MKEASFYHDEMIGAECARLRGLSLRDPFSEGDLLKGSCQIAIIEA
jgi:hypothetical protein